MKQKVKLAPSFGLFFMSLLLFFTTTYVVADTFFGITPLLWGEITPPKAGYVGTPAPLTVQVPSLVGGMYAQDNMPDPTLFACQVTYVYHPTALPATVLEQSPPGGAYRKVTPTDDPCGLSLVVSMGREQTQLPDLCGMNVREAEILLGTLGLCHQRVYIPAPQQSTQDKVLSTEPPAGILLDVGQCVVLEVSQTTPKTPQPCPDLTGLTIDEARLALQDAGLSLGEIHHKYILDPWHTREGYEPWVVIAQGHPSGSFLPLDHTVDVTVNLS